DTRDPLSLHDALPISGLLLSFRRAASLSTSPTVQLRVREKAGRRPDLRGNLASTPTGALPPGLFACGPRARSVRQSQGFRGAGRSEEHTSELQSPDHL